MKAEGEEEEEGRAEDKTEGKKADVGDRLVGERSWDAEGSGGWEEIEGG